MSDQRDRDFVQHSIDTGLSSMQGNPFLAQRIVNQERTEQPVMKKKISFAFILAMILVAACVATAVAGATNEAFNAWLYNIWPEAALKLMPVNMSCTDNGIRMKVESATADGSDIYIVYSLEDLEGGRLNGSLEGIDVGSVFSSMEENAPLMQIETEDPDNPFSWEYDGETAQETGMMLSDPLYTFGENKISYGFHLQYNTDNLPKDGTILIRAGDIWFKKHTVLDLLPLYRQYAGQAKTMPVPEGASKPGIPGLTQVLDSSNSPEIPVADHIYLSGIGMVDGRLHVQYHLVDCDVVYKEYHDEDQRTITYYPVDHWVWLYDADEAEGYDAKGKYPMRQIGWGSEYLDHSTEGWQEAALARDPDQKWERWVEYVFNIDGEPTEDQVFTADIQSMLMPPVLGEWELEVPLRLITKAPVKAAK